MPALAERLGHSPATRLLIVNADDYGMCRAANTGITSLLEACEIDSATVTVPCSWAPEAIATAAAHGYDVGVHLTLTSEWEGYRWGPVSSDAEVSSLVDSQGYFPPDCQTVEQQADPEQLARELRAQLTKAIALGLDPTHADNHMGSVYGLATGRDFLAQVLPLCAEFGLPLRLPRSAAGLNLPPQFAPLVAARAELADRFGVVILDHLWTGAFQLGDGQTYQDVRSEMIGLIRNLRPGVNELFLHPFEETDELRAIMPDHAKRGMELRLFTDPEVQAALAKEGIVRIGWRELRDLQRDTTAHQLTKNVR
jgi:chitin disaccharide deacetylase